MTYLNLRLARLGDAQKILELYKPYIDTAITFELEAPTVDEFKGRIHSISQKYPYLVCEADGKIIGYAYAHEFKERPAYQWDAELSIYLHADVHTRGLGKQMYCCLMDILRLQRVHNVYGIVTLPNEKSQRLHNSLGFSLACVMHKTGYKKGAWRDVAWYEKTIAAYENEPLEFLGLNALDTILIDDILEKFRTALNR